VKVYCHRSGCLYLCACVAVYPNNRTDEEMKSAPQFIVSDDTVMHLASARGQCPLLLIIFSIVIMRFSEDIYLQLQPEVKCSVSNRFQ